MPLTRRDLLAAAALGPALLRAGDARAQGVSPKRGGILQTMFTPEPPIPVPGANNQAPTLMAAAEIVQSFLGVTLKLEPVSALGVSVQAQVPDLLADIRQRLGLTMLFITHDLRVAAEICDRVAALPAA